MSDAALPQARSVFDISESDADFEVQLTLLYPNLSKRKDRLKSYKAQRKLEPPTTMGQPSVIDAAPEGVGFPAPTLPATQTQPIARSLSNITSHDRDFDAQLALLYPHLSKPKDRVKTFKAQKKYSIQNGSNTFTTRDQQTAEQAVRLQVGTPGQRAYEWMQSVPRVGGGPAKQGRLREIFERIAQTDETPILAMRAELVGTKEQSTVFGGKKQNDTATFQSGSAVLTDKRFYMETRLLMSRDSQTIMLRDIQGVTRQTGFANFQDMIEIRTSGGTLKFSTGLRNRAETERIIDAIQTAASQERAAEARPSQPTAPPPIAQTGNKTQELRDLFELHQMGGLTDEEYALAKQHVLGNGERHQP